MLCSKCNKDISDSAKFCPECGHNFSKPIPRNENIKKAVTDRISEWKTRVGDFVGQTTKNVESKINNSADSDDGSEHKNTTSILNKFGGMRKDKIKKALGALVVLLLIAFACNKIGGGDIGLVKDGKLDFDESTTVGNAFENYPYFKGTSWTSFEDKQKRTIVEFTGEFDLVKLARASMNNGSGEGVYKMIGGNYEGSYKDNINACLQNKGCNIYSEKRNFIAQFKILGDGKFALGFVGFQKNTNEAVSISNVSQNLKWLYEGDITLGISEFVFALVQWNKDRK